MKRIPIFLLTAFTTLIVIAREPQTDMGIRQQDDAAMQWFSDAKFGMFIHWGLYAVPARGEWYMEQSAIPIDTYRKYAFDQGDGVYFDARDYHPAEWVRLAKDAGMKYMCLTARHHDGFALFNSRSTNAFTSVQTLHRDLFGEYVKACRAAGLRVGLYFSPIDWRYPGYYDPTGTNCARNSWGYQTAVWHRENADVMKNEVYEEVRTLFRNYGKIDYLFWDGGWLAQQGSDRDAAFFWEPGKYRDPQNAWPVTPKNSVDDRTGRPLGLMGIARKYSPAVICNSRSGWLGDFDSAEGGAETRGPVRADPWEKCLNLNQTTWGYSTRQNLMTETQLTRYLVDAVVRNGNLLLNVGPDRHGKIPDTHAALLRQFGAWLRVVGDSIYGTRGGPWNPVDGQYGFTYKPGKYFIHILPGYHGTEITTPPVPKKVTGCFDLFTRKALAYAQNADGSVHITGLDRQAHNADTVVSIVTDGSTPPRLAR
jgi:alpha-L-fucosidase